MCLRAAWRDTPSLSVLHCSRIANGKPWSEGKLIVNLLTALLIAAVVMILMVLVTRRSGRRVRRAKFIASYAFPQTLRFKLDQHYPELSHEQTTYVLEGLRTWFGLLNANPRANLGMPSKAVDTAWHEFILLTKDYAEFCDHAFGKFMHHTPHQQRSRQRREGLARTYGLSASAPASGAVAGSGLLGAGVVGAGLMGAGVAGVAAAAAMSGRDLFALDQTLGIADGKAYSPEYLDKLQRQYETMRAAGTADSGSSSSGDSGGGGSDGKSHSSDGSDGGGSDGGGSSCGGGCGVAAEGVESR